MKARAYFILLIAAITLAISASATAQTQTEKPSIIKDITADSSVTVIQDINIEHLLDYIYKSDKKKKRNVGYRVQVFSDNNVRTARNEARDKSGKIRSRFPKHETYVTYNQPYWRVRVGDFKTHEEAIKFMHSLQTAFPGYAREMRVVRDYIKITQEK